MRCLMIADLQYDLRKFGWMLAAASHVGVVMLASDEPVILRCECNMIPEPVDGPDPAAVPRLHRGVPGTAPDERGACTFRGWQGGVGSLRHRQGAAAPAYGVGSHAGGSGADGLKLLRIPPSAVGWPLDCRATNRL